MSPNSEKGTCIEINFWLWRGTGLLAIQPDEKVSVSGSALKRCQQFLLVDWLVVPGDHNREFAQTEIGRGGGSLGCTKHWTS